MSVPTTSPSTRRRSRRTAPRPGSGHSTLNPQRSTRNPQPSRGFTLVEILVATAITLVILLMFAQIFRAATGTIQQQRGIAQNDARARMLANILRSDLQKASFRDAPESTSRGLLPLSASDPVYDSQRGYFYISENDADRDDDDVLQFTMFVEEQSRSGDLYPFLGRSDQFNGTDVNQPDMDDGILNDQTISRGAEVSYFLRAGILYRRLLLLRDPLRNSPRLPVQPSTGTNGSGAPLLTTAYEDFWLYNDLSATRGADLTLNSGNELAHINGVDALSNNRGLSNQPIALPRMRFGHRTAAGSLGLPREYLNPTTGAGFFGRFTHHETSSPVFDWPGKDQGANNPFDRTAGLNFDTDGGITPYAAVGNPRTGEDIVLTNVDAFDVKVWDSSRIAGGTGSFVDLGTTGTDWATDNAPRATNNNLAYGPRASGSNFVFDTWHPNATSGNGSPPLRPLGIDVSALTPWASGTVYNLTPTPSRVPLFDFAGNRLTGVFAEVVHADDGSVATPPSPSGQSGSNAPNWPLAPGRYVRDGELVWQIIDNRIGLRLIQITIRYRDIASDQPRQLTIVHSFTN